MKSLILGLAAVASLAAALPAAAQTVDAREHNQAIRIQQGVRSGALTSAEAYRLHRREVRLHRYEARVRYRHHGHLTPWARRHLVSLENRDSRAIYHQKHDGQVR